MNRFGGCGENDQSCHDRFLGLVVRRSETCRSSHISIGRAGKIYFLCPVVYTFITMWRFCGHIILLCHFVGQNSLALLVIFLCIIRIMASFKTSLILFSKITICILFSLLIMARARAPVRWSRLMFLALPFLVLSSHGFTHRRLHSMCEGIGPLSCCWCVGVSTILSVYLAILKRMSMSHSKIGFSF